MKKNKNYSLLEGSGFPRIGGSVWWAIGGRWICEALGEIGVADCISLWEKEWKELVRNQVLYTK